MNYKRTIRACFYAYIVGAIVNIFVPLLFTTFQNSYAIPISQITLLITINFVVQLSIDFAATFFVDKIGYRTSVVIAHMCCCLGLAMLTFMPEIMPTAFSGLVCGVVVYAIGSGLLEVLISPITEACPSENKEKAMSLLHSFYCWGCVGVILISTLFFSLFSTAKWKILALIWAAVPALNGIFFATVPIHSINPDGERGLSLKELFSKKVFWIFLLMMTCAGASEQAVSQWASTFAEKGLGISKAMGDIAGPASFAACMGASRLIYGKYGNKINLDKFITFSCFLCVASYLCVSLVTNPVISLFGCAVCGFSVGILWPGTFSKAAATIKNGGTAMFALLALSGDLGCSIGPTIAGFVSSCTNENLKLGILSASIFPILLLIGIFLLRKNKKNGTKKTVLNVIKRL